VIFQVKTWIGACGVCSQRTLPNRNWLALKSKHRPKHDGRRALRNKRSRIHGIFPFLLYFWWIYTFTCRLLVSSLLHINQVALYWTSSCHLKGNPQVRSSFLSRSISVLLIPSQGYHALTPATFATAMHEILTLSPDQQLAMRSRGRNLAIRRFSEDQFVRDWEGSGWRRYLNH